MIYLDNAATTMRKPDCVVQAVSQALCGLGNAGRGVHSASLNASRIIFDTRLRLQQLFCAESPDRIAFTANSTQALNTAIKGVLNPGDHIITTALEHNSVLRPLYEMEERGAELTIINADDRGRIDYADFERSIRSNTRAIVCTHASNLTGNLLDIARIGTIARTHGLLFIVDASQTAGVFPIDVQSLGIDILCFTGHKSLLGPQGTGGLYLRSGLEISPPLTGGSGIHSYSKTHPVQMPAVLEAGTLNAHGLAGLRAALEYIQQTGIDAIRQQQQALMQHFYCRVRDIPGVKIYGDFSTMNRCAIVALNLGNLDSSIVSDALARHYDISTRPGAHCAPLMHRALGTEAQGAVRFSFSHFNTMEEINIAASALEDLAEAET